MQILIDKIQQVL